MPVDADLTPDPLPPALTRGLLDLAAETDYLLFGEVHGTQEVPRLVAGLLDGLRALGYAALGLEVPRDQRPGLVAYGLGQAAEPPPFFARPWPDGRGSREALALACSALRRGWQVLCFDQGPDQPALTWQERDGFMARNLDEQYAASGTGGRVVAVCGNLHARITDASGGVGPFWPSFAAQLQERHPERRVGAVAVVFHGGAYYNYGVRPVRPPSVPLGGGGPELRASGWLGHTLELHLPEATPATFLSPPSQPAT